MTMMQHFKAHVNNSNMVYYTTLSINKTFKENDKSEMVALEAYIFVDEYNVTYHNRIQ